jgi:hypothetical protein
MPGGRGATRLPVMICSECGRETPLWEESARTQLLNLRRGRSQIVEGTKDEGTCG